MLIGPILVKNGRDGGRWVLGKDGKGRVWMMMDVEGW